MYFLVAMAAIGGIVYYSVDWDEYEWEDPKEFLSRFVPEKYLNRFQQNPEPPKEGAVSTKEKSLAQATVLPTPAPQKNEAPKENPTETKKTSEPPSNIVKISPEKNKEINLKIDTAKPGTLQLSLSTRGKITLDPDRVAHIIPKVSGVAKETKKNIGNSVRTGEVIAVLESQEIADLKAAYLAALSKEKLAASTLEREEKLNQKKITPKQDYLNAKNSHEEARINLQLAAQKLRAIGLLENEVQFLSDHDAPDLRRYEIRSPIDGTVTMRHITKGEYIDNTAIIYELADLNNLWVEMAIYPKDLDKVKEGQQVEILHPNEDTASTPAKLIYVSPVITEETITAKAIADLSNTQGLFRPGTFVKVNIATEKVPCSVIVPKESVQQMDGGDFMFTCTEGGFEKCPVQIGLSDQKNVEILSGLEPGKPYAANNTFLLKAEMNKDLVEDDD